MRRRSLVPVLLVLAACGSEGERRVFRPPMEGQSPPVPEPVAGPALPVEPPAPNTAAAASPAWLRASSPIQWTAPEGWEEIQSTKPMRLVEFTILKDGPGRIPIQFLVLNGADGSPGAKPANLERWQAMYREDAAMQATAREHDGVRESRYKIHGSYEYPPIEGISDAINEANWTMICGWVEGPNGSIMFRVQGPDEVMKANDAKINQLLDSMRPSESKQ